MNDTIALMGTPIVLSIARRMRLAARPLLLTLAFAVTIGSVMTPMGNPQNLLIAVVSGVTAPIFNFLRFLAVPTFVNLVLTFYLLRIFFRKDFEGTARETPADAIPSSLEAPPSDPRLARFAVWALVLALGLIVLVNLLDILGVSQPFGISEVSLFGAASNLIIIEQAERRGETIPFLIFLKFGVVGTIVNVGVLYALLYLGL